MHNLEILKKVEAPYLKSDLPKFRSGDTLKVHVKVIEGESERIQPFEGVVIAQSGSGINESFTIRKVSFGVGIERTFPVHSPRIAKIEIVKEGKVRRAKLYYLRDLSGKAARIEEKNNAKNADIAKSSSVDPAAPAESTNTPNSEIALSSK